MVSVPNVVGMAQADAQASIVAAQLAVGTVTTANSDTVPVGLVISQNPAGGSQAPQGSSVSLVVSSGPAMVSVPALAGMTEPEARTVLGAAGLATGSVTTGNSATVPAGNVISQDPAAGASVLPGTAVSFIPKFL
jgi:serine/threonine-protein kinase